MKNWGIDDFQEEEIQESVLNAKVNIGI